jgi:hypothetical protein
MDNRINGLTIGAGVIGLVAVRVAISVIGFDTLALIVMLAGLFGLLFAVSAHDGWPSVAVDHAPVARELGRSPMCRPLD